MNFENSETTLAKKYLHVKDSRIFCIFIKIIIRTHKTSFKLFEKLINIQIIPFYLLKIFLDFLMMALSSAYYFTVCG